MQLTQKETGLLKDLKNQEKLCVDKYTKHASDANDGQLKNLFSYVAGIEQHHYDIIDRMEKGNVPDKPSAEGSKPTFTAFYNSTETPEKKYDCYLCSDLLATEKHVSHLYDTCVFEFSDAKARDVLSKIQKDEQEHGKLIYDYMSTNGMYS